MPFAVNTIISTMLIPLATTCHQYEFEITKSQVGKEWNKNYKPYVLNLKYGQINGVKYEIRDKNGNAIGEYYYKYYAYSACYYLPPFLDDFQHFVETCIALSVLL